MRWLFIYNSTFHGGHIPHEKAEFIEAVANKSELDSRYVKRALEAALHVISETLQNGEDIVITGFGTLKSVDVPERAARNPQTGDNVVIKAHKVARFKMGATLKAELQ